VPENALSLFMVRISPVKARPSTWVKLASRSSVRPTYSAYMRPVVAQGALGIRNLL
jgi:hypothetical protein